MRLFRREREKRGEVSAAASSMVDANGGVRRTLVAAGLFIYF